VALISSQAEQIADDALSTNDDKTTLAIIIFVVALLAVLSQICLGFHRTRLSALSLFFEGFSAGFP
jgi:hypothetical protein